MVYMSLLTVVVCMVPVALLVVLNTTLGDRLVALSLRSTADHVFLVVVIAILK